MRILEHCKDGGPESTVDAYVLVEIKPLFSIMLLRFADGSREAYHSHAFNAVSWLLKGRLEERVLAAWSRVYTPSFRPIFTPRERFHKVFSAGTSWVLTFRGPWSKTWREYLPKEQRFVTLTNGRQTV